MELDVRIGAARPGLTVVSKGQAIRLVPSESLLKREERTLIWSGEDPSGAPAIVKVYGHRSRRSRIRGRLWSFRVQREYQCLALLEGQGVPCTEPVLWGLGESRDLGCFEVLVTREIPGVVSLRDGVRASSITADPALLRELFRRVRGMHRAGIFHRVLSWKNVLVGTDSDADPRVTMVDMAKAIPFSRDLEGTSMAAYDLLYLCAHLDGFIEREELAACLAEGYGLPAERIPGFIGSLARWSRRGKLAWRLRSSWLVVLSRLDRSRIRVSAAGPRCGPG